jgi:glycosyltransferase involved in cell wall biosynthesis
MQQAIQSDILVSIILVNYNGVNIILDCLSSIEKFIQSITYEVIVVDNASTDGSPVAQS